MAAAYFGSIYHYHSTTLTNTLFNDKLISNYSFSHFSLFMPTDLEQLLTKYTCGNLLDPKSEIYKESLHYGKGPEVPIYIDSRETIKSACRILYENKISSAPILDNSKSKFIGQLDYFDLITHVMNVLNAIPIPDRETSEFVTKVLI